MFFQVSSLLTQTYEHLAEVVFYRAAQKLLTTVELQQILRSLQKVSWNHENSDQVLPHFVVPLLMAALECFDTSLLKEIISESKYLRKKEFFLKD